MTKKYDLGYGCLGNGITVWNRLQEEHGDYKIVAHIGEDGSISFRENLPQEIKEEIRKHAVLTLTYVRNDSESRPVYKDKYGKLWKDVDPRAHREPELCTVYGNTLGGEPDVPISAMERFEGVRIEFIPHRITW